MAQDKGKGPLPPTRPIQPIRGLESGAPSALGPRRLGALQPLRGMGQSLGAGNFRLGGMQPLPQVQDPEEAMIESLRATPINPLDTPSAPYENPPIDTPKSFAGWFKNLQDDITHFIEGVPAMIKVAWDNGKYISKNLDGVPMLYENPEFLTKELSELKTQIIKSFTDTYKDGLGEALYKHPFSVLLDATTVFDIIGGGIKTAGRAALTTAERQALKSGGEIAGSVAARLFKLGDNIQRTPGRVFGAPFKLAGRAALKTPLVNSAAQKLALTPYGLERKNRLASFLLNERVKAAHHTESLFKKSIPKKDWDEYWELATGYKPLELASKPMLAEHAANWKKANVFNEEWMKEFGIKTQAELDQAALKPLADRLWRDGVFPDEPFRIENGKLVYKQEALDAAQKWVEGNNKFGKPTQTSYMPYFMDRDSNLLDLLESMKNQGQTLRTVKRFEKKGSSVGIIKNPQEIQARATVQTAELRGMVNFVMDTIQTRGVKATAGNAPKNHVFMDPILMKYLQDGLIPVHEMMTSSIADDLARGLQPYDALRKAAKKVDAEMGEALISAAKNAADDAKNWGIAIPIEDAYLIESQLRGVSGPLRFYDKLMNTWRSVVLRLMPRYYMNNLLGNSILLLTGGHLPWSKTVADQKILPAEAISASGLLSETGTASDFLRGLPGMRTIERATDWLSDATDSRPRGLLVETKLREIIEQDAKLGDAVANALLAQGSMDDAVRTALAARKESMELTGQQAIAAKRVSLGLEEQRQLQKIDADMAQIQKQMDVERALSNAGPQRSTQTAAGLEAAIQQKISQNAPVADIRNLQEQLRRVQQGAQGAAPNGNRLQDLQGQLERLGKQRESVVGAYPYTRSQGGVGADVEALIQASARRQALAPVAAKVERAVGEMERFLGNYGRLHPLEREWIRRAIPFWTFARTMNQMLFQLPFVRPKTAFLWHHYAKMMIDGANDDRLPARFRNHIPIGGTEDGQIIFMRVSGFNPFEAVEVTEMGGVKIPKLIDPANNPFVKALVETRGGYDTFTERPFVEPTDFVDLTGTIWRYNPQTNVLESVIPQKPLITSLMHQIPHVRLVQEMLDSFPGTRGVADIARKDPEGNYFYDRSPMWAASRSLGFPVTVSDPGRVRTQHQLLIRGMIKRFQSASRRVDPETREKLLHILNDLGSGGYELREW